MITTIKHGKITWTHLDSPDSKEVSEISNEYSIHQLIAEQLISPTMRPKADKYEEHIYLILHFPIYNPATQTNKNTELDMVIGKNFLITASYAPIQPLNEFLKQCQTSEEFRNEMMKTHAGIMVYSIMRDLYRFSIRQLDHTHVKINHIEEQIFSDNEKELVRKISLVKKDIIDFRRTVSLHSSVLSSYEKNAMELFGPEYGHYMHVIFGEFTKINNLIESNKETVDALYETNESLLTHKTNEIMKKFTIMAFMTFPLVLFVSLFAMGADSTPIIGQKHDFWIIIGLIAVAAASMLQYFKRKKWF